MKKLFVLFLLFSVLVISCKQNPIVNKTFYEMVRIDGQHYIDTTTVYKIIDGKIFIYMIDDGDDPGVYRIKNIFINDTPQIYFTIDSRTDYNKYLKNKFKWEKIREPESNLTYNFFKHDQLPLWNMETYNRFVIDSLDIATTTYEYYFPELRKATH